MKSDNDKLIEEILEGVGFEDYLEEQIDFPFQATYEDEYGKYGQDTIMKIISIDNYDEHYGFLVKAKLGRKTLYLPLCELTAISTEKEKTKAAVELYGEYFWNR